MQMSFSKHDGSRKSWETDMRSCDLIAPMGYADSKPSASLGDSTRLATFEALGGQSKCSCGRCAMTAQHSRCNKAVIDDVNEATQNGLAAVHLMYY